MFVCYHNHRSSSNKHGRARWRIKKIKGKRFIRAEMQQQRPHHHQSGRSRDAAAAAPINPQQRCSSISRSTMAEAKQRCTITTTTSRDGAETQ
ncbi:hypothetical protein AB3S75_024011 [Citrus x aurantiifolia]